jgi:hypothetical protein
LTDQTLRIITAFIVFEARSVGAMATAGRTVGESRGDCLGGAAVDTFWTALGGVGAGAMGLAGASGSRGGERLGLRGVVGRLGGGDGGHTGFVVA